MSGRSPVNPGAERGRLRMRGLFHGTEYADELHRWAGEILPAGSVTCSTSSMTRRSWPRHGSACPGTRGADPGIDKDTVAIIETGIGVEAFLDQIRDSLKSGEFRPVPPCGR